MKRLIMLGILAVLLIPGSAHALTYTFDGLTADARYDQSDFNAALAPGGYVTFSGGTFVAQFGASSQTITLSITGIAILTYYSGTENLGATTARFTNPTDSVSIAFGDYTGVGADIDNIYLKAYNASDALIEEVTYSCNLATSYTLSVSAANIAYVVFGSTGDYPNSVYWDNFTFNERPDGGAEVPEPSTMLLLGTGLLGLVGISQRKLRS